MAALTAAVRRDHLAGEAARQAVRTIASVAAVSSWSWRSRRGRQKRDHAPKYVDTRHRGHANHGKLPRSQPG